MSALREQYGLLGNFMKGEFRKALYWCIRGMIAATAIGFLLGTFFPDVVSLTLEYFTGMVEDAGIISEDGSISVFSLLFNNWWAMLISAAYGFLPFIFLPLLSLFTNGLILGVFAAMYIYYNEKKKG